MNILSQPGKPESQEGKVHTTRFPQKPSFHPFLLVLRVGLASILLILLPASQVRAERTDGNNRLGQFGRFTLHGNVLAAGVGLRGTGTGTITISDIPDGAMIYRAFLYWATIGSANTFTTPTLGGETVEGDLIGRSGDTCWGAENNFVYRADVTSLVTGNGSYSVAGLPASLDSGNDSQGASLVVIYSDASESFRRIIIHDGAVTLDFTNTSYTDTFEDFSPDSPVTDAHVTYLVGDGQEMWETGNVTFNDESIADDVFSGVDGNFWGTHTFDVTDTVSDAPATTTINNNDPDNPTSPDCLLWAASIFSVTSQQPPQPESGLSEFTRFELNGAATSAGVGLRGRGEGEILVTGIPFGAAVYRAYLYWATIGSSAAFTNPALNDQAVDGELIGTSADTCWGADGNFVYRADVSSLVRGNGQYMIAGLPDSLDEGNDSQGASLVIVYLQVFSPGYKTIVINDGAVTLDFDRNSYTDTISDFTVSQPVDQAQVTYIVGDGQGRWDTGSVTFNDTSIAQNVFTGVDGDYWGTITFDVTSLVSGSPATTTINNTQQMDGNTPDCLLWASTVFSVSSPQPDFQLQILPLMFHSSQPSPQE